MHANAGWTTYEVGTILFALHALETLKIHCRGLPVGSFHHSHRWMAEPLRLPVWWRSIQFNRNLLTRISNRDDGRGDLGVLPTVT